MALRISNDQKEYKSMGKKEGTELEASRRTTPTGMKTMPMMRKEMMTGSGVRIGCHAFSFC